MVFVVVEKIIFIELLLDVRQETMHKMLTQTAFIKDSHMLFIQRISLVRVVCSGVRLIKSVALFHTLMICLHQLFTAAQSV